MTADTTGGASPGGRSGQVLPLVFVAALALLFAALWLADIHRVVLAKDEAQNAGDAAALVAARWLGDTLNLEGDLNLAHAAALAEGDADAVEAITNAQVRALFSGPLAGVSAAQTAAKRNGVPENPDFTAFVRERAALARRGYSAVLSDGSAAMPEPWPGAWTEYADMLEKIAARGVAAGVDNADFYEDPDGAHWLLETGFHDAVLGRDWCWFRNRAPALLSSYSGWRWWPALPDRPRDPPFSAELLPIRLHPALFVPADLARSAAFADAAERAGLGDAVARLLDGPATNAPPQPWIVFDRSAWGEWTAMKDPAFPLRGRLRREYDVAGADAVFRVEKPLELPSRPDRPAGAAVWSAAAKPLGWLPDPGAPGGKAPANAAPVVLPVWRATRLVPLDASSMPSGGSFDLGWREHRAAHLPRYLARGPGVLDASCRWCRALAKWEDPDLRRSGSRWLSTNAWKCAVSPPGSSPGGGTGHAH